jgi:hypothetical protein
MNSMKEPVHWRMSRRERWGKERRRKSPRMKGRDNGKLKLILI